MLSVVADGADAVSVVAIDIDGARSALAGPTRSGSGCPEDSRLGVSLARGGELAVSREGGFG